MLRRSAALSHSMRAAKGRRSSLDVARAPQGWRTWRACMCVSTGLWVGCHGYNYQAYGMRSGANRVAWLNGCCDGDQIIIDFRDEQSDGNGGSGMLYINNTAVQPNTIETYRIEGELGYTWKSYGPFCAYQGWHNFTYTSDANPEETSFTITDSYGLVKAQGDMNSLPLRFHTILPSKFCTPDGGYTQLQTRQRVRKLIAAHDQTTPRAQLLEEGLAIPQDEYEQDGIIYPPLSFFDNNHTDLDFARRASGLSGSS